LLAKSLKSVMRNHVARSLVQVKVMMALKGGLPDMEHVDGETRKSTWQSVEMLRCSAHGLSIVLLGCV
jgi:hypothetical protein